MTAEYKSFSRRQLLTLSAMVGAAALSAGCNRLYPATPTPEVAVWTPELAEKYIDSIPTTDGKWTVEQMVAYGELMLNEIDFPEISYAGSLLMNNVAEKPAFAEAVPLFSDQPYLRLSTSSKIPSDATSPSIAEYGKEVKSVSLKPRSPQGTEEGFQARSRLNFRELDLGTDLVKDRRRLATKLIVAASIHLPIAIGMVLEGAAKGKYLTHIPPNSLDDQLVVKTALFSKNIVDPTSGKTMPMLRAASFMSDLLILPSYQKGMDRGLIDTKELQFFREYAETFLTNGDLVKQDESYKWQMEGRDLYAEWLRVAFKKSKPIPTFSNNTGAA